MVQAGVQLVQQASHLFQIDNLAVAVGHAFYRYAGAKAMAMHARIGVPGRIMAEAVSGIKSKFAR